MNRPRGGASYPCPKCKGPSEVKDTRRVDNRVVRQRACLSCGKMFLTKEIWMPTDDKPAAKA